MDVQSARVLTCLLLALICVHSANGSEGQMCFKVRGNNSDCTSVITVGDSLRKDTNCCNSPHARYYVDNVDSDTMFRAFWGFPINNCLPCRRGIGKTRNRPDRCANYTICRTGHSLQPVCGTDGKTYDSECDFKRSICYSGRTDVEVAYNGSCRSGCDNVACRKNLTCIVDQYNLPNCVDCKFHCTMYSKKGLVCGADGLQYESACHLRLETCRQGKTIGVAYKGSCIANATCDNINCHTKQCVQDNDGRPRCITCLFEDHGPRPELSTSTTLCGTDNETYTDYYTLRKQMCTTKSFIDVKHHGPCEDFVAPPQNEERPRTTTASKSCKHEDLEMYYITLKHFAAILRKDFGLQVKRRNKNIHPRDKIILVRDVISSLQKKWKKIISRD